jgi:hypothetical protein
MQTEETLRRIDDRETEETLRGSEIAAQLLSPTQSNMDERLTPPQAAIIKPEQALSIKPFGLDAKILLTTEATGGATSVLMA